MLHFSNIMLFSENPQVLNDFYKKVFQKEPDMNDNGFFGYIVGKTFLGIGPHDKVKGKNMTPERIMLNFDTEDVKGEFDRIKALGAEVVAEPYQMGDAWIATFADVDGNYFQLMTPWKGEK